MTRTLTATQGRPTPAQPGLAFLLEQLRAVTRSPARNLPGPIQRIALTFRPCRQGRDAIPDHSLPFDAFQLLALVDRIPDHRRPGTTRSLTLVVYKPSLDPIRPGPVRFRQERAYDLDDPRPLIGSTPHITALRSAIALYQAIEDAQSEDFARTIRWPRFSFVPETDPTPGFDSHEFPEFGSDDLVIDGLPDWSTRGAGRTAGRLVRPWPPGQVLASLAHLKGRAVRNPAFAVLQNHGLLPRHQDYRSFLDSVTRPSDRGPVVQDPRSEHTETGRIRRLIESYLVAEPVREPAILADLQAGCLAMGVRLPQGPEQTDVLADLLDNPWTRPRVSYAAGIQLVDLASPARKLRDDQASTIPWNHPSLEVTKPRRLPRTTRWRLARV